MTIKNVLHIVASPRGDASRSRKIAKALLEQCQADFPGVVIDELDLHQETLPELNVLKVRGRYLLMGGGELTGESEEAWAGIEAQIARFLAADLVIISTPMWNFNVPYKLKHYIDIILQPGYTFHYTENGPEGLAGGRRVVIISARGGDYRPDSPFYPYDQLVPYLNQVFSFVGVDGVSFISAQPLDLDPAIAEETVAEAITSIRENPPWS